MTLNYTLLCSEGHETPAEYTSIALFEKTRDLGWLECATCLMERKKPEWVRQGLSTPAVNSGVSRGADAPTHSHIEDVGGAFYGTAIDMARGSQPKRSIKGACTDTEKQILDALGFPITWTPIVS